MATKCPKCGAAVVDGQSYCTFCGEVIAQAKTAPQQEGYAAQGEQNGQDVYAPKDAQQYQQETYAQPQAQQYQQANGAQQGYYTQQGENQQDQELEYARQMYAAQERQMEKEQSVDMPMGWYKFVIYFQLIAGPVLNIISGILVLTGMTYDSQESGMSELVYRYFPSLSVLDKFYGVALIAVAVFGFLTRQKLAHYCKVGPTWYLIYLGVSLAVGVIYTVGAQAIMGNLYEGSSSIGSYIGLGALIGINYVYFGKRKHLFVNE